MLLSKAAESDYIIQLLEELMYQKKSYYFMSCQILLTIAAVFTPLQLTNSNENY